MKFCLIINSTKQWQASLSQAMGLANAILAVGHHVDAVFLYGQAVKVIQQPDLLKAWQQWQEQHPTRLLLCATQLENLGIEHEHNTNGFEVVGLASLTASMEAADRTVELC